MDTRTRREITGLTSWNRRFLPCCWGAEEKTWGNGNQMHCRFLVYFILTFFIVHYWRQQLNFKLLFYIFFRTRMDSTQSWGTLLRSWLMRSTQRLWTSSLHGTTWTRSVEASPVDWIVAALYWSPLFDFTGLQRRSV